MILKSIAFLFCDGATKGPDGKTTLYGIYDQINCSNFPLRLPGITIYWKIRASEEGEVILRINRPDGLKLFQSPAVKLARNKSIVHEGIMQIGNIEFALEGDYEALILFNNDQLVSSELLKIRQLKKPLKNE